MKKENTAREPHALDGIMILKSRNSWKHIREDWDQFMTFEDRFSWVHSGHIVNDNSFEWISFYLDLADHYSDDEHFSKLPRHGDVVDTITMAYAWERKSTLSKKAFVILCEYFFGAFTSERSNKPCPYVAPYKNPLFSKLIWFFHPHGGYGGYDNLRPIHTHGLGKDGGKHYLENANAYARHFCIDAWYMLNETWRPGWSVNDTPDPKIAWPLRREIIALLRRIGHIKIIESEQYAPTPRVFKEIILSLCEEDNTPCTSEDLDSKLFVSEVITELARKSHPWAASLFVASAKMEWRTVLAAK